MRKYYAAGGVRVAQRQGSGAGTSGLTWLLGDHLGSTAITANGANGTLQSELRFKPWGEPRFVSGATLTDRRYTVQRAEGTGLVDYGARFYDPSLGRWVQPDSLIPDPGNSLDFDRYQYVRGNPLKYVDPSGHMQACADGDIGGGCGLPGIKNKKSNNFVSTNKIFLKGGSDYSEWNSGDHACAGCHYAKDSQYTFLSNDQWAEADANARTAAVIGSTAALTGTAIALAGAPLVTAACADGDCSNEAVATYKSVTVLGRYSAYLEVADDIGGNVLNNPAINTMTTDEAWEVNQAFLDQAVARGDYFYLASKWEEAVTGSFFRRELDYLISVYNYTIAPGRPWLIPPDY